VQGTFAVEHVATGLRLSVPKAFASFNGTVVYLSGSSADTYQSWRITMLEEDHYKLAVTATGKLLDAASGDVHKSGCRIGIWDQNGWPNQSFRLRDLGDGTYTIHAKPSRLCLSPPPHDSSEGALAELHSCVPNDRSQLWRLVPMAPESESPPPAPPPAPSPAPTEQ
jgi:hypothetical protein